MRRYLSFSYISVLALMLASAVSLSAETWKKYSNPQDGFEVELPGEARITPTKLTENAAKVTERATDYGYEGSDFTYVVNAALLKRAFKFDILVNAYFPNLDCKITKTTAEIKLTSGVGRRIVGQHCLGSGRNVEVRYFAKGLWFYQVVAATAGDDFASARHFLDSFKITLK